VYCYAVRNRELAAARYKRHDPHSEFLFPPPAGAVEATEAELPLFQSS
jgi:hypothetical protein